MTTNEFNPCGVWIWPTSFEWADQVGGGDTHAVGERAREVMGVAAMWVEALGVEAEQVGAVCEVRSRAGVMVWALGHDVASWEAARERGLRFLDDMLDGERGGV